MLEEEQIKLKISTMEEKNMSGNQLILQIIYKNHKAKIWFFKRLIKLINL